MSIRSAGFGLVGVMFCVGSSVTVPVAAGSVTAPVLIVPVASGTLPSYFDGCAFLPADQIAAALGQPVQPAQTQTLAPEGFEAAACQYSAAVGGPNPAAIDMIVYTKSSVELAGSDFSDDSAFIGEQPLDTAGVVDVTGVGDRARFGHPADDPQTGVLLAVQGEARVAVTVYFDPSGGLAAASAVATRLFQNLVASPPPPDAPAVTPLRPGASTFTFGDGRSIDIRTSGQDQNAVLTELTGPTVTGQRVYFNGNVPPELDLRNVALSTHGADRIAVLQFASPVQLRTSWRNTPAQHRIEMVLRPPSGVGALDVEIQPDGSGAVISDPDGQHTVVSSAPVVITGNWAAIVIPAALGVGPDWTAQAIVRIETATPMPGGASLTGWVLATLPVPVASLTGENSGTIDVAPPAVLNAETKGSGSADGELVTTAPATPVSISSAALDTSNGRRMLTVTFNGAPALPSTATAGPNDIFYVLDVTLAPPGALGTAPPLHVRWILARNAAGGADVPTTASVTGQAGEQLGTVPVDLQGQVMKIDLAALTAPPAAPATTTTTVPAVNAAPGKPTIVLGGPAQQFRLNVQLSADQCICSTGAPAGYSATSFVHDSVEVVVSGTAIAFTRQSTGTTAVGALDPLTGAFQASNATEFWSGVLDSGIDGAYAQLSPATTPSGFVVADSAKRVAKGPANSPGGGGWSSILDPLNNAANQISQGSPGGGPVAPSTPCGPIVTYQLYAGHGVYVTTTRPPPFAFNTGFDQNQYDTNYEFGKAVSGRWPAAGCSGAAGFRTTPATPAMPAPSAAFAAPAGPSSAPGDGAVAQPVTLADLAANWSVTINGRLDVTSNQSDDFSVQASPVVRVDRQSDFTPLATPQPTTDTSPTIAATTTGPIATSTLGSTPGAVEPVASAPQNPPTTGANSSAKSDSGSGSSTGTVVIGIVAVFVVGALVAGILVRRRRQSRRA